MKVVVPTGYMGSGSSAITNLLAEYDHINVEYGDFEFCFLHCPNGILDLEDKLFSNNNFIRSDEAIKTFRQEMEFLNKKQYYFMGNYHRIFKDQFLKLTYEYLAEITTLEYDGLWYYHERPNNFTNFIKFMSKIVRRLAFRKLNAYTIRNYKTMELSLISKSQFYEASRKYIDSLIATIADDEYVVLDQLVLPFNLHRIKPYFNDNLYPIVVTRDPRDVFVLNKYVWKKMNSPIPFSYDVHEFCRLYRFGRENELPSSVDVLRVAFEDLVLNYDLTVSQIESFLSLTKKQHIRKKAIFNPSISIKNIGVYRHFKEAQSEIEVIEKELAEYLYEGGAIEHNVGDKKELF